MAEETITTWRLMLTEYHTCVTHTVLSIQMELSPILTTPSRHKHHCQPCLQVRKLRHRQVNYQPQVT